MIDRKTMEHLLISAFEGGSTYWFNQEGYKAEFDRKRYPFNTKIVTPKGEAINLDERLDGAVDVMYSKTKKSLGHIIADNWDAEDADVFFQAALLRDVIYG